jgi:hypothetical protein
MKIGRFLQFGYSMVGALALVSLSPSSAMAQDDHDHAHMLVADHREQTPEQRRRTNALVDAVKKATAPFINSPAPGYELMFGCVSGGDFGAMGMHFVNGALLDGEVVPETPEIMIYEPLGNGRIRLTGADYLVTKEAWEANPEHTSPPELFGQLFHLFESPNRFNLPAFYTLHVWAWKDNPVGTFSNWNPNVSCDAFNGKN